MAWINPTTLRFALLALALLSAAMGSPITIFADNDWGGP